MKTRTPASVTDIPCTCRYLERSAEDPDLPIEFDESTGEFHFQNYKPQRSRWQQSVQAFGSSAQPASLLLIYHCPFCGGTAPKSKRDSLFQVISRDEEMRLAERLQNINTMNEAVAQLGKPDLDSYLSLKTPETADSPLTIDRVRFLRYHTLSAVADVCFTEGSDGRAYWQLQGKYKGFPDKS